MDDPKREGERSRAAAISGGSLALFGSGSVLTSGGGLVAQIAGHVGTAELFGIYGSAALIAVVGSITAIVKILAERPPDIRKAGALAKIAKKQQNGTILLMDKALDRESATNQVLEALKAPSVSGGQRENPGDPEISPTPGQTDPNVRKLA